MNTQPLINPFPGLRPFRTDESHLFFGREGQSEEVLKNLVGNRFVAVIGASGSGKSSLMYCGVIPVLYGGFATQAGSHWKLIATRPGNSPLENLADAVAGSAASDEPEIDQSVALSILRRNSSGLKEAISLLGISKDENILLMIDQFEELFRFRKSKDDPSITNDSESYVKLLVEAVLQEEVPIYIVLTMRSDFIGECSNYQELTELINRSNYLIPQMTREDFRMAIEGPVSVAGAVIDPQLVQLLLNEVGDNPDQLPILQHALMRSWEYWIHFDDPARPIGISDYEAVGKMSRALSEHANEAYDELKEEEKEVCESMFKTLTEKGSDNRGIRHPTTVKKIAAIAGTDDSNVIVVAEAFRKTGRSFLTPAPDRALNGDSVIDLSHESLMRIWNRLKIWVDEEAQAVQMYSRLAESAAMYQQGKTNLWRPPDLHLALSWKIKQNPNLEWARRYNTAYERTMVFLQTSEKEYLEEEENKVKQQKRALRRTRVFAIVLGSAAIISLGFMVFAFDQKTKADENRVRAVEQSKLAEERKEQADRQRELAQQNERVARDAQQEADLRRNEAEEQRSLAIRNETRARQQETIALQREKEASEERARAVANAEEAERQRIIADANAREAYQRRLLSIAQSMSVKSVQITQDNDLKGLLAYQAYLFNMEYGGPQHNQDVFSGLYESMKTFNGDSVFRYSGHLHNVNALSPVHGSNEFYSAGSDGMILKWNSGDPVPKPELIYQDPFIKRVLKLSRDNQWLACGTEGKGILVFETTGKEPPLVLPGHGGQIRALAFFPGKDLLVSAGLDQNMIVWNTKTWQAEKSIPVDAAVQSLSVTDDGNFLAAGLRNGAVILLESSDWKPTVLVPPSTGLPVYVVAFSNRGDLLVTGDISGTVKVFDWKNKRQLTTLRGHTARINDIVFCPHDHLIATAGMDGKIQLWDNRDWSLQPVVIDDTDGFVFSLAFSRNGNTIISGSSGDNRLMLRPTQTTVMVSDICSMIDRNMTNEEWNNFVGEDIPYSQTCPNLTSISK